jgi:hypothetical protein
LISHLGPRTSSSKKSVSRTGAQLGRACDGPPNRAGSEPG